MDKLIGLLDFFINTKVDILDENDKSCIHS